MQGYFRASRLFLQINRPKSSLKMIQLASERLQPTDTKRHAELAELESRAMESLKPPPIFNLPVELLNEICKLAYGESNPKMLTLTLVCKHWRDIILNSPEFWRHLIITKRTKKKKVKTWLERSRGVIFNLEIREDLAPDIIEALTDGLSEEFWSSLRTLKTCFSFTIENIGQVLPPDAFNRLQLENLELELTRHAPFKSEFWNPLSTLDTTRLKSLTIMTQIIKIPWSSMTTFNSLRSLKLNGIQTPNFVLNFLQRNLQIEELRLSDSHAYRGDVPDEPDLPEVLKLNHLKHLELDSVELAGLLLHKLRFPNLTTLSLSRANNLDISFLATQCTHLPELIQLSIVKCTFVSQDLSAFIRSSSSLRQLTISSPRVMNGTENNILEALCGPSQELCVPKLQHLYLPRCPKLQGGTLFRFIKARLPREVAVDSEETPLPLLSLNIDDCPEIEANTITWLRAKVPSLTCRLTVTKMKRFAR